MIYFYWYLGIGAVVIILMVVFHKFTKKKDDNSLSDVLTELQPEQKSRWYRLLNDVLGPTLVGTLIVPIWPLLVFFKVKELVFGKPACGLVREPEFAVTRDNLQTQLSILEIEKREIVFDPLGSVPNVPFGHLNEAWKQFCEDLDSLDSIWSFSAHWASPWGGKDFRQGYAIVRGEEIRRHFIIVWQDIEEGPVGLDISACLRKQAE